MDGFFARLRRGGVLVPFVCLGAICITGLQIQYGSYFKSHFDQSIKKTTNDLSGSAGNTTNNDAIIKEYQYRQLQKQVESLETELHQRSAPEAMAAENQDLIKKVEQLETELQSTKAQQQQVHVADVPTVEHAQLQEKVEKLETELHLAHKKEQERIEAEKQQPTAELSELKETVKKLEAELELKRPLEQENTRPALNEEALRPKSCQAILQRMHEWNNCWRRHMMANQDNGLRKLLETNITCDVLTESGTIVTEVIGAPLYHYAHYKGQGFGRVVGHSAQACVAAFVFKRPCLINLSSRDKYYTWRSFINENTYPWNPSILHNHPNYTAQLEEIAQKLPNQGIGQWKANINSEDYENGNGKPLSLVFPMDKIFEKRNYAEILEYYSGNNPLHGNQVMFSPNWGDAWFTKIPGQNFQAEHRCKSTDLATLVQNAMYTPTDLGKEIHQVRYNEAVSTLWNKDAKEIEDGPAEILEHRIRPHLSAPSHVTNTMPSYGSIHIRTIIVELGNRGKIDSKRFVDDILVCLMKVSKLPNFTMPENWWVLADNSTLAEAVTDSIHAQQEIAPKNFNGQLPNLKLFHNYNLTAVAADGTALTSSHSDSVLAKGLYGHQYMSGSIEDWIALHESKVTILTTNSGYSLTGASGNGKMDAGKCGSWFTIRA